MTADIDGSYRFSLLIPGQYSVGASASGFESIEVQTTVSVGSAADVNMKLSVGSASQTVEVTEAAPLVQTENADIATIFNTEQISAVPNPGNDIAFMGQLAPGSGINTTNQAANGLFGSGNFSSFGLPRPPTASPLTVRTKTIPFTMSMILARRTSCSVTTKSRGRPSSATPTLPSSAASAARSSMKSPSRVQYLSWKSHLLWNGRILNANSHFNNQQGVSRPFVNDNQWAASVGGPIRRDKFFFFMDTEGIRFTLSTSTQVFIPTASYQTSVLGSTRPLTARD